MGSVIGGMAAAIAVPIVFAWLSRRYPLPAAEVLEPAELKRLKESFHWTWVLAPIWFFLVAALVFGWIQIFDFIGKCVTPSSSDTVFLIRPGWPFWVAPSILLGVLAAVPVGYVALRAMLGAARFCEYRAVENSIARFDAKRVGRMAVFIVVPLCLVAVGFGYKWYTRFDRESIVVSPLLRFAPKQYAYRDLVRVEEYILHGTADVMSWRIVFRNGDTWESANDAGGSSPSVHDQMPEIMRFVAGRAGVSITHAR
jgi:hypothetical protein